MTQDAPNGLLEACKRIEELKASLRELVSAINATGGCLVNHEGLTVPVADEDWVDLGDAYLSACTALRVKPVVKDENEHD